MNQHDCPFCSPPSDRVFHEGNRILGLWDAYPVSDGHALLVTKRHVSGWYAATAAEQEELMAAVAAARTAIVERHRPDGFNIGINDGAAAGQTVSHLHVHVIPRYAGDVPNPRGGVRGVIPGRADYTTGGGRAQPAVGEVARIPYDERTLVPHVASLITGRNDPLLPHLVDELDRAGDADLAVAFVLSSGVDLLFEHLRDLLARGGRLRLLTGDYLEVTEPRALFRLLDLEGDVEIRVFEARETSFHPKSYMFHYADGSLVAYVGSSNLTRPALGHGLEWNYRVTSSRGPDGIGVIGAFEELFRDPATVPLSPEWIHSYARRRAKAPLPRHATGVETEPLEPPPTPHEIQQEALDALEETRAAGNRAGLVVLATGLGKTWLSAFDSARAGFDRVLFVAHREEILEQAKATYRRIRPEATLGSYTGKEKVPDADVLFASIQTIGRAPHLIRFDPAAFDYIVVDEFHHAAARTYRKLLDHFAPKFLLGLTATPDRTDGADLLALCGENLVFRCDLFDGIEQGLLSPFHYFGVPDEVDYENIPWRSSRFDEEALTKAVATQRRAQNALDQFQEKAGTRALGFCVSQVHADFMAEYFREAGLRASAVHSGARSAPRATSLEQLRDGDLDIVFAVDMFNEGVDLPNVDTVMMLRPTESSILWLQQLGRGLRVAQGKSHLTVIDYIGNHRIFLTKPRTLFQLGPGDGELERVLNAIQRGDVDLPPGCEVTYDLEAQEILRSMIRTPTQGEALRAFYEDFRNRNGVRPSAVELFHAGYNPRAVRSGFGSWLGFVRTMGDLSAAQVEVVRSAGRLGAPGEFLSQLETTQMTKSYKMVVLLALLNQDSLPGSLDIAKLTQTFRDLLGRYAAMHDIRLDDTSEDDLRRLIERQPIAAWTGAKGTGGHAYFEYGDAELRATFDVSPLERSPFQELVREIVDWRLAEYVENRRRGELGSDRILCKVIQASGRPILKLPARDETTGIPFDWVPVEVGGKPYEAKFAKIAVNVIRPVEADSGNELPAILRGWFGPDVGQPGTSFHVQFEAKGDGALELLPLGSTRSTDVALWQRYSREEIPKLWGFEFSPSRWNQGFIVLNEHVFLLVTLEKQDLAEDHQYEDAFLSPERFRWQSQNRTAQGSGHGEIIRHHEERGYDVHLFVRPTKRLRGKAAPFIYCGDLTFERWEGEKPITVWWRLKNPVPATFRDLLGVPGEDTGE